MKKGAIKGCCESNKDAIFFCYELNYLFYFVAEPSKWYYATLSGYLPSEIKQC